MSLNQLLPSVTALPHGEKLQLMQWLADQLTREEGVEALEDVDLPALSPYDSFDASEGVNSGRATAASH